MFFWEASLSIEVKNTENVFVYIVVDANLVIWRQDILHQISHWNLIKMFLRSYMLQKSRAKFRYIIGQMFKTIEKGHMKSDLSFVLKSVLFLVSDN